MIAFGTHNDVITGISEWLTSQWVNVWPKTENFRFDNAMTRVLSSDDQCLVTVIAPWTSTGFHEDGTAFDRPGRATLIFQRTNFGWSCIHSHMSLNRGVPQASYGRRVGWLERLVSVRAPVAA